ncbi:MAG: LptA/OstA family protein [Desulfobacterales bacterium]|nr:LptA/OstA family protein [Desulfobacterales bacterium]
MRRSRFSRLPVSNGSLWRLFLIPALYLVLCIAGAQAQNPVGISREFETEKIQISADNLITTHAMHIAEFSGNVRATMGTTVIVADRLKIFYAAKPENTGKSAPIKESIKKITADGNVKINFDDKVAVANHAEYITEGATLVLSGADSKITSGSDSISGAKITYHKTDGRIRVEGDKNKRVEAVFFQGKKL